MNIERLLPGIQKNVLLKKYTTFQIGGPAKYFFVAKTKTDLIKAIKMAEKHNLPFFVLGGGSNLLVSDRGYSGLIIKFQVSSFRFQGNKVYANAGALLSSIVQGTMGHELAGLEWAAGIPGTIGGAIHGNAAAFGGSIKDIVREVKIFDAKNQKIKNFKNEECEFGYRTSIFSAQGGKKPNLIILSCQLKLKKNKTCLPAGREKIKEYINYRKSRHPHLPSAGCIFRNPKDFSAAELIDRCGLKGEKSGSAQISQTHPNFIVNLGGAKAKDVLKLINLIKKKVKEKFGIKLEEEVQFLE